MSIVHVTSRRSNQRAASVLNNTTSKVKAISLLAFYLLFCVSFVIIVGGSAFANNGRNYTPIIPLGFGTVEIIVLFFLNRYLVKHSVAVEKYYYLILASALLLLLMVNVKLGYMLRFVPEFDLGAIFTGAKEWAKTGDFMSHMEKTAGDDYFYYFPFNFGGMTLLFCAFKIVSVFGWMDYYAIAMVTNALLVTATVLLVILVCRRLFGASKSLIALAFVLLSPPFYLMAPVFYTTLYLWCSLYLLCTYILS